ncbi:FAD-dependent oxidoreductase [Rhodoplanes sp. Z2-YC6860]|uniref:FAD-dependent oxidoreductase n=1 Tax=Rhodoplanes sp. Z2-YC6860 TaxID=674703 RepID=UPI000A04CD77|nr:NAD(P)/FAD-dependent oxidoreductase [Rhodoplanes sp. Z2-YC6860]
MREADVVIAGGGLAGSFAAAMLGRAGIGAAIVDPHTVYPEDFRCEKLDGVQMHTIGLTGLTDAVLRASTADRECWVARFGHVLEKRPGDQQGIMYDTLVNTARAEIPASVPFIHAKVMDIATGPERQTVKLSNGDEISARLVVVATGLNPNIREKLDITRDIISAGHSISIGFNAKPADPRGFPFPALTYFSESPTDKMAYITLFPVGSMMRANLFGYRHLHDPWLKKLREAPRETLYGIWPGLRALMGDFTVDGFVKIRPVDLYVTGGYRQQGVVLVGDAFATSCPAAGTGARKALVDVERLCNVHIPQWLKTPGMGEGKIAAFYDDPVKRACDDYSSEKAFGLRAFTLDTSAAGIARRWIKFGLHWGKGTMRSLMTPAPSTVVHDDEGNAPQLARGDRHF